LVSRSPNDLPTRDILDAVFEILTRYCTRPTAQSVLNVARQRAGVHSAQLTRDQLFDMLDPIERSLSFFLTDKSQAKNCRRALETLASVPSGPVPSAVTTVPIRVEDDIVRARTEARGLAIARGFTVVGQTRLMTAVSELARNIVFYAGAGTIELSSRRDAKGTELRIVASDRGPGIEPQKLESIFAGTYKSERGLGKGLVAVQKLVDDFQIETRPGQGTTVSCVFRGER
jgi:serine/threonine-protein kinase RsbT